MIVVTSAKNAFKAVMQIAKNTYCKKRSTTKSKRKSEMNYRVAIALLYIDILGGKSCTTHQGGFDINCYYM